MGGRCREVDHPDKLLCPRRFRSGKVEKKGEGRPRDS
jgi:hypothetical protein